MKEIIRFTWVVPKVCSSNETAVSRSVRRRSHAGRAVVWNEVRAWGMRMCRAPMVLRRATIIEIPPVSGVPSYGFGRSSGLVCAKRSALPSLSCRDLPGMERACFLPNGALSGTGNRSEQLGLSLKVGISRERSSGEFLREPWMFSSQKDVVGCGRGTLFRRIFRS